jgi:hypothetical protein
MLSFEGKHARTITGEGNKKHASNCGAWDISLME